MASPNKNPDFQAKLPRNGHDLSHDFAFTAAPGMILPIVTDFLQPGEKVSVGVDALTQLRTPFLQNAQVDMEQIVDYFFVPMTMLYSPFGSMVFQTADEYSSNFPLSASEKWDDVQSSKFPCLDLSGYLRDQIYDNRSYMTDGQMPLHLSLGQMAFRLYDMLGYNPYGLYKGHESSAGVKETYNPNVFPYGLLAYHAVYEYYYRVDQWARINNLHFNFDRFFGNSIVNNFADTSLVHLHFRPRYLDYFTNVHVSPLVANKSTLTGDNNSLNYLIDFDRWLSENPNGVVNSSFSGGTSGTVTQVSNFNLPLQAGIRSINSTQQVRNMFAAERFLQVTARAGQRFDDQVLAHLGYKVPVDIKHNVQYLGTTRDSFGASQVVSTSDSSDTPLGTRAAIGTGGVRDKKAVSFVAPTYGVLIALYSTLVKPQYEVGFERYNVMTDINDIWQPEFDHLGMQPVFGYELRPMSQSDVTQGNVSKIMAWQWRYEQWKRRYNRVSKAFVNVKNKYQDISGTETYVGVDSLNNDLSAYFNVQRPLNYSVYRYTDVSSAWNVTSYFDLLQAPTDLNNLLVMPFNPYFQQSEFDANPYLIYSTDPFVIDCHVNYKKVSPMSVHSVPDLR